MGHKQGILMVSALVVLVVLLVGCNQSNIRIGWVETSSPGHLKASYGEFTGEETRTVLAQSGETLYLEYDAEVENGSLHLKVHDPYGETVWCIFLCEDCGETKALPVYRAGCYTISIQGEAAEGCFDLKWVQK